MQHRKKTFFGRASVRIAIGLVVFLSAILIYFSIVAIDRPPIVSDKSALDIKKIQYDSNSFGYGNSWIRKNNSGLWEVYLEGSSFNRGVAFGQLTRELLYYQESAFFEQIKELIPSDSYLKVLKYFIAFFNRNLNKNIISEYQEEIYGTSFACNSEYDFIGTGYQRQLNYHAAHDIGHALQNLNMVACTAFSVWDSKSTDSSLLIGRNFDFYMGDKFAENKIVCFVNPDKGYKFMMITWADLIGVVSGMNEKGLTVTINASKSSVPSQAATPVTLLAREILQYSSDISEAYEIAKKRNLFVSESIMIGSAKDHRTAIIEKSPDKTGLFETDKDYVISTNHFQGETFKNDEKNIENIAGSDSYNRYLRVEQLINRQVNIGYKEASDILRDRLILDDKNAGMGNQLSINQNIAHHSVIFNADSLIAWVSTYPWQSGEYIAYDLKKIFSYNSGFSINNSINNDKLTIPVDTFLNTQSFKDFLRYKEMTKKLYIYRKEKKKLPDGFAEVYIESNRLFYLTYKNLGDYYIELKDYKSALNLYSLAQNMILPGNDEKNKLIEISSELSKKIRK